MLISFLFVMHQVVQGETRSWWRGGGWGESLSCRLMAGRVTNSLLQPLTKKHSLEIKNKAAAPDRSLMTLWCSSVCWDVSHAHPVRDAARLHAGAPQSDRSMLPTGVELTLPALAPEPARLCTEQQRQEMVLGTTTTILRERRRAQRICSVWWCSLLSNQLQKHSSPPPSPAPPSPPPFEFRSFNKSYICS